MHIPISSETWIYQLVTAGVCIQGRAYAFELKRYLVNYARAARGAKARIHLTLG
mgnify:CR=1 FL=1